MAVIRILELFCGTKSISNAFEKEGFETITLDVEPWTQATHITDLMEWDYKQYPSGYFDVVWASPPCQTYSLGASRGGHRRKDPETGWNEPVSTFAFDADDLVRQTRKIIIYFKPKFYFMENPRAGLRHTYMMDGVNRNTVWYCKYGDTRAKPTDIFYGTWPMEMPIRTCKNHRFDKTTGEIIDRQCHHEIAHRGDKTGTQGLKNARERGRIPEEFCTLLARSIKSELLKR